MTGSDRDAVRGPLLRLDARRGPDVDERTLDAFRAGDPNATRAIYRRYAGPVATVARAVVGGDRAFVDDIVQETFVRAWRACARLEEGRDIAPWLYTIARRTAIDLARAERRPTRGDHEPQADVPVLTDTLERTWERYEIRRALDALPPDEREVVRLGHLAGLTHPEIAERLGVPVGTVKSRSFRAHRRLARLLAHLAAAATVLVVALLAAIVVRERPQAVAVTLAGSELAPPAASAIAEIDAQGNGVRIVLSVRGLAPAPPGSFYAAWVVRDAPPGRVGIGTFHMRDGDGTIELWSGVPIAEYPTITVTLEAESDPDGPARRILRGRIGG